MPKEIQFFHKHKLTPKAEKMDSFTGGPLRIFEDIGRLYLTILLKFGLYPDSKVLDVGCGCLRGGYWLIQFLNEGNYYGIEPNREMIEEGKEKLDLDPEISFNQDFDFSVFDTEFDFVIARSIWSHASLVQIEKMLDSFKENTGQDGIFLTSYYKTKDESMVDEKDAWIGKSHKSDQAKHRYYTFGMLRDLCINKNLKVSELDYGIKSGQIWLLIVK